MRIDPENFK